MCAIQRKNSAILKYTLYIDIVVGSLFQAVCIQIKIDTIQALCLNRKFAQNKKGKKDDCFQNFSLYQDDGFASKITGKLLKLLKELN